MPSDQNVVTDTNGNVLDQLYDVPGVGAVPGPAPSQPLAQPSISSSLAAMATNQDLWSPTPKADIAQSGPPLEENYEAAYRQLKLNPQEQYLYQTHLENLDKGGVLNKGGLSTLFNMTREIEGKHYVLPRVWPTESGLQILSPDEATMRALSEGIDNFPSYKSEDEATKRYNQMHEYMEQDLMKSSKRRGQTGDKTKLAGEVVPFVRPQQTYGPGTDWDAISKKNKALATQATLMRALGAQNVLPIKPEDK
jgi:hypothetical protein